MAQRAGLIRDDLNPDTLIRMVLDLSMHWHQNWGVLAVDRNVRENDSDAVEQLHQERLDHIIKMVFHGIVSNGASAQT